MSKPRLTLDEVIEHYPFPFCLEARQKEDILQLADWGRAIGDLPVGYGKTAIATAVALMLQPDVTVILVPPILVPDWVAWLNGIPNIGTVVAWDGSPKYRAGLNPRSDWLVMSYGVFLKDSERLRRELRYVNLYVIVDECHNFKNFQSKRYTELKQLTDGQHTPLMMSGTLLSSPEDSYSYIKLTNPGAYTSNGQFRNIHVKDVDFFGNVTAWQNLDLMQKNLSYRRVRRLKEEVHADLIKPLVIPIFYDLPKEHMRLYKELMNDQLMELTDGSKIDASTAQRLYHYSQQIITNWGYFANDSSKKSTVFELIDQVCEQLRLGEPPLPEQLDEAPHTEKLILWTQYKMTSRTVQAYMQEKLVALGKDSVGAWSETNSRKSVHLFMNDPNVVNMTAQPGSVGAGLNPQYVCRAVGYVEIPTRTIAFIQSSGRIYRKGQKYQPLVWLFVARNTIQESLLENLQKNDDLVNRVAGNVHGIRNMIFPNGR